MSAITLYLKDEPNSQTLNFLSCLNLEAGHLATAADLPWKPNARHMVRTLWCSSYFSHVWIKSCHGSGFMSVRTEDWLPGRMGWLWVRTQVPQRVWRFHTSLCVSPPGRTGFARRWQSIYDWKSAKQVSSLPPNNSLTLVVMPGFGPTEISS